MDLTEEQMAIADQVSEVLNQAEVTDEDIRRVRELIKPLPARMRAMYEEGLFLVENDETR